MNPKKNRLVSNTLTYGIGNILLKSINLLLLPVFTAYLSPADYGISTLLTWLNFLIVPILSLGVGTSMAPVYFENKDQKNSCVWTTFTIVLLSGGILTALGIIFSTTISNFLFQTTEYAYLVTLSLLTIALTVAVNPFMLFLQFEERARAFVILSVLCSLSTIMLSVLMVVVIKKGVQGLIEAQFIGQVVIFLSFATISVLDLGKYSFKLKFSKQLLKIGLPLIPASFLIFLLQDGNKYLLKIYHGIDALGIYSIGFNIGLVMAVLVTGFQSAWVPYFMSFIDKKDEAKELFSNIMTNYIFIFGSITLLFFIGSRLIVYSLTQPNFYEAFIVVGFSATAQFFYGIFSIMCPSIYFASHVSFVSLIQLAAVLIALPVNYYLVKNFGLQGAAFAVSVNIFLLVLFTHGWNLFFKDSYFFVKYQWKRIVTFTIVFLTIALISISDRQFMFWEEVVKAVGLLSVLLLSLYIILTPSERIKCLQIKNYFTYIK